MPGLGGLPTAKLAWYARRLRSMDPREVATRARTAGATALRRVTGDDEPDDAALLGTSTPPDWEALLDAFRAGTGRPVLLDRATAVAVAAEHPEATKELLAAADRVLEHRFTFFAHPETPLSGPDGAIDWWHDPLAGFRWPDRPSHAINHRTLGDPKWIWELNRLQHLPWLAQAWLITGDPRYGAEALDQLDSWIAANPPGHGIAWRGAFEVGVRALSVTVALQGLADHPDLDAGRYRRAVRMLAAGARRCWRDRSRHSSANNHLVGELAGLAAVALAVPELAAAPRWETDAVTALAAEADRQILGDGVGAEQAVGYQVFTAELVAVVALLRRLRDEGRAGEGRASGARRASTDPRDARLLAAVERSAGHLADLVGTDDPTPRTGDDDEGFALRLDPAPTREVRPHLALVAAMTGLPAAGAAGEPDLTSAWVARRLGSTGPAGTWTPTSAYAPDGGLAILRAGRRRVTVDVGPLGYLSIAAHGHADALAVGLAVDGHDVVGDPGTGSYFAHPAWRTAHRSTRAHATVAVDDADQSVMAGPFLWTGHAGVTVHEVDLAAGRVDAEHDGYRRLEGPVVHRRLVEAPPDDESVLVVDVLVPRGAAESGSTRAGGDGGTHTARTTWPLHPDLSVDDGGPGVLARRDGRPVLRVLTSAAQGAATPWRLHGGEDASGSVGSAGTVGELGWWSERLESRRACWFVGDEVAVPVGAPTALATVLVAGEAAATATTPPEIVVAGREVRVRWAGTRGPRESTLILPTA